MSSPKHSGIDDISIYDSGNPTPRHELMAVNHTNFEVSNVCDLQCNLECITSNNTKKLSCIEFRVVYRGGHACLWKVEIMVSIPTNNVTILANTKRA